MTTGQEVPKCSGTGDEAEVVYPLHQSTWSWLVSGFIVMAVLRIIVMLPSHARQNDFAHYYLSSRLLIEGKDSYRTRLQPLYDEFGFSFDDRIPNATNPPPLLWIIVPFSLPGTTVAHWLWSAFNGLSLAACLVMTRRMACANWPKRLWGLAVAVVLWSYPVFDHFAFSQVQLELAALLLGAFGLQRSGRPGAACALATLAATLKIFPVLMLPWFVFYSANGWREILRRIVIVGTVSLLIVATTGWALWQGFIEFGLPIISKGTINQWGNQSLPSLVLNIAATRWDFELSQDALRMWWLMASATGAVSILTSYLLVWATNGEARVKFSVLLFAIVVSGTTAWTHYFVFLIWPAIVAVDLTLRNPSHGRLVVTRLMIGLLVIPVGNLLASMLREPPVLVNVLLSYVPLFGAVLTAGLLVLSLSPRCFF